MVYDCHHAQCCHTLHKDPNSTLDKLTWMQVKHQLSPLQTNIASHETRILTPSHRRLSCGNQSTLQDLQCYENILRSSNPSRLGWYSLDLQWQIWLLKTRAMLITGCSVNIVRNKACSSQREPITLGTSLIGSAMADMMVRAHRGCQYCLNLDRTTTTWRLSQRHTATGYRNST